MTQDNVVPLDDERAGRQPRKRKAKSPSFILLLHDIVDTPAWSIIERAGAAPLLIRIWRRHNGQNNGRIVYSQREAERQYRCSPKRAAKWFAVLQATGFIVAEQRGSFRQKTGTMTDRATRWRLTTESHNGSAASREYLQITDPEDIDD